MKRIFVPVSILLFLFVSHIAASPVVVFKVCLNGVGSLSCEKQSAPVYSSAPEISIKTKTANHLYPNMGIQILSPDYVLKRGCTPSANGMCLFSASDTQARSLYLEKKSYCLTALCHNSRQERDFKDQLSVDSSFLPPSGSHFIIETIIHPLSMNVIQPQGAVIGSKFGYDLKSKAVQYYEENQNSGKQPQGVMSESELQRLHQLGLEFDRTNLVISGIPNAAVSQTFRVGVKSNSSPAIATTDFKVNVNFNKMNTPVYKTHYDTPSAIPIQHYQMNLMDLLEKRPGFQITNQVSFRVVANESNASWLKMSETNPTFLEGKVPREAAGNNVQVTVMAHSNTGGDAETPLTLNIPVTFDPAQKPIINYFEIEQVAGGLLYTDISNYILDPANDANLKVILDKIEPEKGVLDQTGYEVPKLSISKVNPKILEGVIPEQLTGYKYQITLYAHTDIGGDSDSITIPLQLRIDPTRTPRFKEDNPNFPILYPGQDYYYDFTANKDVFPEYEDAPYEIQFAEGFKPPYWLKLKNNKLTAEAKDIPEDLELIIKLELVIKNIPGGSSQKIPVSILTAAN